MDIEKLSAEAVRFRQWPEVLQVIKGAAKSVAMALEGSTAYVNGDYLLIQAPEIAHALLKKPELRKRMREAVFQLTGRSYKLGPYRLKEEGGQGDPLDELMKRAGDAGVPVTED